MNIQEPKLGRNIRARWIIGSFFSPLVAGSWAVIKLLRARLGWRRSLVALSIMGNVAFLVILMVAYIEERKEQDRGTGNAPRLMPPGFTALADAPLTFCRAAPGSELSTITSPTLYVAYKGVLRGRFEFNDETPDKLEDVAIFDILGRPWIDADLEDRTVIYDVYDDSGCDVRKSFRDKDGDGIPDIMIDWRLNASFERAGGVIWSPLKKSD